jgi:hypothetical protein
MAEQSAECRTPAPVPHPNATEEKDSPTPPPLGPYQDAIRQAMSCLDTAGKRLKRGEAEQADEILNLLRAATTHLQQALEPRNGHTTGRR